jgi:hypothetical protein
MSTYYDLPFDVILLIETYSSNVMYLLSQVDKYIAIYLQDNLVEMQDYFTKMINGIYYLPNGLIHRNSDKPAIEHSGYNVWYQYGIICRNNDQPTYVTNNGKYWYKNNKILSIKDVQDRYTEDDLGILHRDNDLPAVICTNDRLHWYKNGQLHRDGDRPAVIYITTNHMMWCKNGQFHRDGDKPAIYITSNHMIMGNPQ